MVATYIDRHGTKVHVHQRAGRRSMERLGYTLYETDEHDDDVDLPPTPEPSTPEPAAGAPNVGDVLERGDVSGTVDTGENPLGEVKLDPDAEPAGAPAPWTAEAENVAAQLDPERAPADPDHGVLIPEHATAEAEQGAPEPKPEPEPSKPAPAKRSPRRGKAAAADE